MWELPHPSSELSTSQHSSQQLHPLASTVSRTSVISSSSRIRIPHSTWCLQPRGGTGSCAPQVTAERVTCDTALGEGPSTTLCLKTRDGHVLFTFHPVASAPTEPSSGLQAGLRSSPEHPRQVGLSGSRGQPLAQGQLLRETRIFTGTFSWHDSPLLLGRPAAPGPCPKTLPR